MANDRTVLSPGKSPSDWSVVAQFDEKQRLVVNEGNLDDDFYIIVTAGEISALKRVLDRTCKPRAKSGDLRSDVLQMLAQLYGERTSAFSDIKSFFNENGIDFQTSHWIGSHIDDD